MAERANITDVKALRQLRSAFVRFSEDASVALIGPGARTASVIERLRRDALPHWKREIRQRSEEVVRANTKLIQQTAGDTPRPSVDARLAYEAAKRRVREAEEKYAATEQYIRRLEKELENYRVAIAPMVSIVRVDTPKAMTMLDRSIQALDAYAAMQLRSSDATSGASAASNEGSTPEEAP
ncbi:MAG: hypothetical protein SFY96_02585 [Planctomycetota bacterium]|nr:hypothetical protein [Planctomycetota bacterium]